VLFILLKLMSYEGVPKELTGKMDKCVKSIVKDGKSESSAIAMCKMSILSSEEQGKVETTPGRTVASKLYQYFSDSKINTIEAGTSIKNVEIFKAGTYRNIEWKKSALDKMVSNFYHLKSTGVFPHVPVRANHPGMFEGGDINKVGGYVSELKRVGKKLVADIRVTDQKMKDKIEEGTYINRSAEIGTYDDNEGNLFYPTLFGFAWVDIPQVEGLSPIFSYSKNKNLEIINLNDETIMGEEIKDVFPAEEETVETPAEEVEVKEETPAEVPAEEPAVAPTEVVEEPVVETPEVAMSKFSKEFPEEFAELEKLRIEKLSKFVDELKKDGKVLVAQAVKMTAFVATLNKEQFSSFEAIMKDAPKLIELDKEVVTEESVKPDEVESVGTPAEKAKKFIEETN
jgi:hypothetical protein